MARAARHVRITGPGGPLSARGDQACRSFERTWRGHWTALARPAPALISIDLVLAEALIAGAERARFAR